MLLSISTANTADLLLWKSYYVFCFQKMPYIPIISNQSSFITSRRIEMMLFIVKLWIIVCMGVCVCVCVPIHQGPSGVRGVRGEKVNTNDSRPLFQFVHVTMRASPHKHSAHVNKIPSTCQAEMFCSFCCCCCLLSGRRWPARGQRREGACMLMSNKRPLRWFACRSPAVFHMHKANQI